MKALRDFASPVGPLWVEVKAGAVTALGWGRTGGQDTDPLLATATQELADYFAGQRFAFDLPLRIEGSPFQQAVCAEMQAIPFGETRTYGEIAQALGATAQAVGQACGNNPIPILVPCHRVMGADGKLVGFSGAGGVETKVALLKHEGAGAFLL